MILPLIRELSSLSKVPNLGKDQRERTYSLMRSLREYGFTNHELFVIFRRRVSEASIKRKTRGVEVMDTVEHDEVTGHTRRIQSRGFGQT